MHDEKLLIHWPMDQTPLPGGAAGLEVDCQAVRFEPVGAGDDCHPAAVFDGRQSVIAAPHHTRLSPGADALTIAAWIHTAEHLPGVVGDLVSKFDFEQRRGLNLSVVDNQGVASAQSNYRNLHWGIDDGQAPGKFVPTGSLGAARLVWALTVHHDALFAGTCEPDACGRVWRLNDDDTWADLGAPDGANSVITMASFNDQLYVGTGAYRLWGSNQPPARNATPGGRVYVLDAATSSSQSSTARWRDCGKVGEGDSVNALTVHAGQLFAADFYAPGVFVMEQPGQWRSTGLNRRVVALTSFAGCLWAMLMDGGQLMRYHPQRGWEQAAQAADVTQLYGAAVHRGRLHLGGFPRAWTFRLEADDTLTNLGHPGHEAEVMGMVLYNGKLYGGTLPLANVYRYDEHRPTAFEGWPQAWNVVDTLDNTPGVSVRRAWSLCVYRGALYGGTLPGGHVCRFEAGRMATWDRALPGGWRHVAAVRDAKHLRLYVDGVQVACSRALPAAGMNLDNTAPLRVGQGAHAPFCGALRDFRWYARALDPREIGALATARTPAAVLAAKS